MNVQIPHPATCATPSTMNSGSRGGPGARKEPMGHVYICSEEADGDTTVFAQAASSMEGAKWILLSHVEQINSMGDLTLEDAFEWVQPGVDTPDEFKVYWEDAILRVHKIEVIG